jgi:hypothetical protein
MIVTSMQLTISSRRDIAVLKKESSALEGGEDVNNSPYGRHRVPALGCTGSRVFGHE